VANLVHALPDAASAKVGHFAASAVRTHHAVKPSHGRNEVHAHVNVLEVSGSLQEALWKVFVIAHGSAPLVIRKAMMHYHSWCVKYILAFTRMTQTKGLDTGFWPVFCELILMTAVMA
jgi:hypothetical protein